MCYSVYSSGSSRSIDLHEIALCPERRAHPFFWAPAANDDINVAGNLFDYSGGVRARGTSPVEYRCAPNGSQLNNCVDLTVFIQATEGRIKKEKTKAQMDVWYFLFLHGTKAMMCRPEVHLAIENKVIDSGLQIASVPLTDSVKYCLWRQNTLAVVNIQRGFTLIDGYTKGAEHNVWRSLNKQIKIALLSPPKVTENVRFARRFISRPFNLFQLECFFPCFCS